MILLICIIKSDWIEVNYSDVLNKNIFWDFCIDVEKYKTLHVKI